MRELAGQWLVERFNPEVLRHDRERRETLLTIAARALDAVDPETSIKRMLLRKGSTLQVGDDEVSIAHLDRCLVLGFGKAAAGMGRGVAHQLAGLSMSGLLVSNAPGAAPPFDVLEAAHPIPDESSVIAGHRMLECARSAGARDLVVVLISGGGSALLTVPATGLGLLDISDTNATLLRCGAPIADVNAVRKHLSAVKGGRLAEALAGAGVVVTLVLSDVVGNSLDAIASGPMVADSTSFADALAVLDRFNIRDELPEVVLRHLSAGARGDISETPAGGSLFEDQVIAVIADAATAGDAAAEAATRKGHVAHLVTSTLEGEARDVARKIVRDAAALRRGEMFVYAGETTVTVRGSGLGGRNQELALAAAIALDGSDDIVVLSIGTDGIDGPTPAAGAFGDGTTVARGREVELDAADHLDRNDSHSFLRAIGDTVVCGPTGTNVGDLVVVYRSAVGAVQTR